MLYPPGSFVEFVILILLLLFTATISLAVSNRIHLPFPVVLVIVGILLAQFEMVSQPLQELFLHEWFPPILLFILLYSVQVHYDHQFFLRYRRINFF